MIDVQHVRAESLTHHAVLIEHHCIVTIHGVSPYRYRNHLTTPATLGTGLVVIFKLAHYVS